MKMINKFRVENDNAPLFIITNGTYSVSLLNKEPAHMVCNMINSLVIDANNEIEDLKRKNHLLKEEQNRLVSSVGDTISAHNRIVLETINNNIEDVEKDLEISVKAGMPTGSLYAELDFLEQLKEKFQNEL